MDIGFICNSPTRPTLIFQGVGVSLILAQRVESEYGPHSIIEDGLDCQAEERLDKIPGFCTSRRLSYARHLRAKS